MLIYLDGYSNHKDEPNENFAREMFELYSIGKGPQIEEGNYTNFTEDDIKAATRILTGWVDDEDFNFMDPDTGLPIGKMSTTTGGNPAKDLATGHDTDEKIFSSIFNNTSIQPAEIINDLATAESAYGELNEMMDMLFDNPETARYIVRKLYRYFVYHFISDEVEQDVIVPLAQNFQTNDYSIPDMLKVLLKSQHFFDEDTIVTSDNNIGALAHRYQTGDVLMKRGGNGSEISFTMDVLDWVENSGLVDPTSSTDIVTVLTQNLLAVQLNTERFNYFLNTVFLDTLNQMTWLSEWNKYVGGGDDLVVRERLEILVSSIIQTPEFQLI